MECSVVINAMRAVIKHRALVPQLYHNMELDFDLLISLSMDCGSLYEMTKRAYVCKDSAESLLRISVADVVENIKEWI